MTIDEEIDNRYANWLLSKAIPNGECLECHFADANRGYRKIRGGDKAHRFICDVFKGPIPKDKWALHTCDNRACINPEHLYIGDRQDNVNDMMERGRYCYDRQTKITNEDHSKIESLLNSSLSYSQIGARFGVTKQTIYRIAKGIRQCR